MFYSNMYRGQLQWTSHESNFLFILMLLSNPHCVDIVLVSGTWSRDHGYSRSRFCPPCGDRLWGHFQDGTCECGSRRPRTLPLLWSDRGTYLPLCTVLWVQPAVSISMQEDMLFCSAWTDGREGRTSSCVCCQHNGEIQECSAQTVTVLRPEARWAFVVARRPLSGCCLSVVRPSTICENCYFS